MKGKFQDTKKKNAKWPVITGIAVMIIVLVLLLTRCGGDSGVPTLIVETPQKLSLSQTEEFTLDVTVTDLGETRYPAMSMSVSFDSSRLEFLGVEEGNIFILSDENATRQQLPDWSCNVKNSNDTGLINIMYLDMTGGKNAFTRELLAEDYNVVLRLRFRLRGSVRPGDVLDLILEDAVFAASDETQSLAMTTDTLKTKNGRLVIGELMMKKILSLLLAFTIMLSLCACQRNFGSVNLSDSIAIPEDGMIKESIVKQIKDENAIGVFTGESGGLCYEWTIFGSDITEPKEINLAVSITETESGDMKVSLSQGEPFGFSALLSIRLEKKWTEDSATAYQGDKAVASVSLTGSKDNTILNCILDGSLDEFVIKPDALPQEDEISAETEAPTEETTQPTEGNDDYLSKPEGGDDTVYTDGKDKYLTDPIPEGKPKPVEPEDQEVDKGKTYTCTFSIECSTILNNLDMLDPEKLEMVPSGGVILAKTTVTFYEGESVFDVLQRLCKEKGIHMESSWTPIYNSAYIEGIHNLYEFDCGELSGWMYRVNSWYPNYGCSRYQLKDGDVVEWRYTCDLGNDVGRGMG